MVKNIVYACILAANIGHSMADAGTDGKSLIQYKYTGCYDDVMKAFDYQDVINANNKKDPFKQYSDELTEEQAEVVADSTVNDPWKAPLLSMEAISTLICPRVISASKNNVVPITCAGSGVSLQIEYD